MVYGGTSQRGALLEPCCVFTRGALISGGLLALIHTSGRARLCCLRDNNIKLKHALVGASGDMLGQLKCRPSRTPGVNFTDLGQ